MYKKITFPKLYHFTLSSATSGSFGCFPSSSTFGIFSPFNFSYSSSFYFYFFIGNDLELSSPTFKAWASPRVGFWLILHSFSSFGFSSGSGNSCMVLKIFAIKLEEMDQKVQGCSLHS